MVLGAGDEGSELPSYLRSTEPEPGPACYEVRKTASSGRHLVATRRIPAGAVIFSETPLLIAPEDTETGCLGCCRLLSKPGAWVVCRDCGGPLCRAECRESPLHRDECQLMKERNFRFRERALLSRPELALIGTLRLLLLKGEEAARWRELEAHVEKQPPAAALKRLFPPLEAFDDAEVRRAYGALTVNCFSYSEPSSNLSGTAVVYLSSLMNHSCVPNAHGFSHRRVDAEAGKGDGADGGGLRGLRRVYLAATAIEKGQEIVINYDSAFNGTAERQAALREARHFSCKCRRCTDPAELGLHCGAVCCAPCQGRGLMEPLVPERAGEMRCRWRCGRCRQAAPGSEVFNYLCEAEMQFGHSSRTVQGLEDFLQRWEFPRGRLPRFGSNVLWAKYKLAVTMYGKLPGALLKELSAAQLLRLDKHCRDLLEALAIAEPGYSLRQGKVQFALCGALLERVKRSATKPLLPNTEALMAEAVRALREAEVALRCASDVRADLELRRQDVNTAVKLLDALKALP